MLAPPNANDLAPGGNRGEAKGTFIQGEEKSNAAAQLDQALLAEQFGSAAPKLRDLAVIADWRDELHAKIRRAQMRLELVGDNHHEQDLIADEVLAFKQLCRAFMATMAMPMPTPTPSASRRAA